MSRPLLRSKPPGHGFSLSPYSHCSKSLNSSSPYAHATYLSFPPLPLLWCAHGRERPSRRYSRGRLNQPGIAGGSSTQETSPARPGGPSDPNSGLPSEACGMPRGGTGEGLAGHRRHRSGILGHLAIRGHRGGDVGIYFYWNGGRFGTPHIVPELSSKHHLRGGSRRKTPSRTREAFLGRRRRYSATMPRKNAGLHSPCLPKHAPCTCEMGDASDEMIQKP